jgi:hypothetical protein
MRWTILAWAAAALVGLFVSLAILRNPVQITDSLIPILEVQDLSPWQVFLAKISETRFSRPLYWIAIKLLLDNSGGHYALAFKAFHVLLVAVLFACFVRAARVQTRDDALAFLFSLVVLTGMHTFLGMVWEGYPVNHYLEVAVFCMAALVLCQSRGGWLADLAAAILFVVAALTLESGLLVWVVFFAARLVGQQGVSWRGVAVTTVLLGVYMVLRFSVIDIGLPLVGERATGFGFSRIEPDEIRTRFVATGHLYYFYLYNVVSAFASIFLSEPTGGRWTLTQRVLTGDIDPRAATTIVSALVATGLFVRFAIGRRAAWRLRQFDRDDQIVLIFIAVALGNAAICYSYVKDEVMSTAGVFYAIAVFAAARHALPRWASAPAMGGVERRVATAAFSLLLFAGSASWTIRATDLQYQMLRIGAIYRYEWAHVDEWLQQQNELPKTAQGARLVFDLREEAMRTRSLSRLFVPRWALKWFVPE